jgi:hypothetical protein
MNILFPYIISFWNLENKMWFLIIKIWEVTNLINKYIYI